MAALWCSKFSFARLSASAESRSLLSPNQSRSHTHFHLLTPAFSTRTILVQGTVQQRYRFCTQSNRLKEMRGSPLFECRYIGDQGIN
jgi:hypothetical protein